MRRGFQRNAGIGFAERLRQAHVHDVIHHPHRDFCDARGKFLDLDAVELIDIDLGVEINVGDALLRMQFLQHRRFKLAQFAIGDDKKIAAAAGGIEEGQAAELFMRENSAFNSSMNSGSITFRMFFSEV